MRADRIKGSLYGGDYDDNNDDGGSGDDDDDGGSGDDDDDDDGDYLGFSLSSLCHDLGFSSSLLCHDLGFRVVGICRKHSDSENTGLERYHEGTRNLPLDES